MERIDAVLPPVADTSLAIEQSIPARFEQVARAYAERVAVQDGHTAWTYARLDAKANAIGCAIEVASARESRESPAGATQATVVLLLDKGALLVAALLGVLKAGRIYVALDPTHRRARAARVVEDVQPDAILTDAGNLAAARALAGRSCAVVNVETVGADSPRPVVDPPLQADSLAYLVYTSGSTGAPKGVVQTHRNVLHNVLHHSHTLRITVADRLTMLASCGTAQAMTDLYSALMIGAALYTFDVKAEGLERLARWLRDEEITIYHSSASIYRGLVEALRVGEHFFPALRVVKLGSEQVFASDVAAWERHFAPNTVLVNALSSSEAMTFRQMAADAASVTTRGLVPVGYAVAGKEVELQDASGRSVSPGEPGEIIIRSSYLSPGYWRRPDLTRAAFGSDPITSAARCFRTGDMGRMSSDGCLEYLGRKDDQVKVRGFRIEVGEVEAAILASGVVREAVVAVHRESGGDASLVAYVVPSQGSEHVTPPSLLNFRTALRESLRERLPEHMIPGRFDVLDRLPLGPSGKVERSSLAGLAGHRGDRTARYLPPWSPLESQIVHIWEELLGVPSIGVQDDFFELGGHSLLAVRMIDQIERMSGRRLPLVTLYSGATVEHLTTALLQAESDQFRSPLVEIQTGGSKAPLFLLHGDYNGGGFYCRSLAQLLGPDQPVYAVLPHGLDGGDIPETIEAMAADRLRTLLDFQPSGPYQLAGYCNGGLVAFEMARQLEELGQVVKCVVVIDASAASGSLTGHDLVRMLLGRANRIHLFTGELGRRTAGGIGAHARRIARRVSGATPPIAQSSDDRAMEPEPSDIRRGYALRNRAYHSAIGRYVPRPFAGRVVLLRSGSMRWRVPFNATAGWSRVAANVDVQPIAGSHLSCLTVHVADLAERLRSALAGD